MAKLTARFDIQDRITKKIRTIRGEIDKLERARSKVNKPVTMTMRARDMATKILKKLHIFVLKDIAKTHTVTVQVKDKATKALTAVSNFMKRRMPRTHALFVSVKDRATPVLQRISRFTQRNLAKTQSMTILAIDRAIPIIRRVGNFARSTLSRGYNFTVRGIDMASRIIGRISSYAATAIPRVRTFTIRAINAASSVIGSVKRALFSLPTLFTVTLAAVGVGGLTKATVGSAMNFEDYGVSMDHWLKGDKKASANLMDWMGQKADLTPYNSADIFPAMVGAVSLAGDDLDGVKRLTSVAIDMAALTPGRTVEDAMQALKNVKMGEYSMMSGFGKDLNKETFEKMGWEGFVKDIEVHFRDGALKLSDTGRGQLNMLKGYMTSQFRSMGDGVLESMKPRLQAVTQWLLDNPKAWGKWKKTVEGFGAEAGEWVFSKLEKGFSYIKSNYLENDDFKKLNFEGKIAFISEDIGRWWNSKGKKALNNWWESSGKPWAEKIGLFMGEAIFNGILVGITEGGKALGGMWSDAFKDPSLGAFGGAGVATVLAGMLASMVLSPLITAVSVLGKGVKGAGKLGKKVAGWFGKEKGPKTPVAPTAGGTTGKNKPVLTPKQKPMYSMPWTNRGEKPVLNMPNANKTKAPKMPKGLSKGLTGLGNFAKRIPVIGSALGALTILTAKKEDKAGAVGAVGGGLGGAALGAAIGSVVPGLGTAIGGIIGGIAGSIGGGALGDWLSDNWSAIKESAASTGKWISEKFKEGVNWTKDSWGSATKWFESSVWKPISEGAESAGKWIGDKFGEGVKFVKDKWSSFSGWFEENIWTPISNSAINTMNFMVGLFDMGREWASEKWADLSGWFDETVWEPIKTGVQDVTLWINERMQEAKMWILETWADFSNWFDESVWTPVKTGVAGVGLWIYDKYLEAKEWVFETWSSFSEWFSETVWEPIKEGATTAGLWISERYAEAKAWISENWAVFSEWFEETVWTPIKTGAETAGQWISDKYTEAKGWITETWGVFSEWFDTTVWEPIKSNAEAASKWISDKYGEAEATVKEAWGAVSGWFEESVWSPIKSGAEKAAGWISSTFDSAKEAIAGAYDSAKEKWDKVKSWTSKFTKRGEGITGVTPPGLYTGTNFHKGGPAIVGERGQELIRYPNGSMSLSPGTDTLMNLPRGTEVLTHRNTVEFFNQPPAYADGIGFGNGVPEKVILPSEQVDAATTPSGSSGRKTVGSKVQDIIVQITGESHYHDDMDAEKVGRVAVEAVKEYVKDAVNTEGEGVYDL